jgi:YtkA-like protein
MLRWPLSTLPCFGALLAAGVSCLTLSCSDSGDGGAVDLDQAELAGTVSCSADPRVDKYTPEFDKPGELGVLSFRLSQSEPAPPAKGNNTFQLHISDANGAPVTGELKVDLKMPDHGHGTSVKAIATLDEASGVYTVTPVYLFMPGVWRVELDAYAASAQGATPLDRGVLYFCIEG